jgi:phosphoribosylformylglycinamidine cyclo-ligase
MDDSGATSLRYRDAGVDIDRGNRLIDRIRAIASRTYRPGVLGGVGGFASLFKLPMDQYRSPVLVTAADGVGTKLRLAVETSSYETVGIDLVAMCANDVLVQGAEPVLFLDYLAMGRLELSTAQIVIEGVARGCELAGASLVGGECAEMPGVYSSEDFDLAGFCLGLVEEDRIVNGAGIHPGDRIIGLPSSGLHSNGFSLVRKVLEVSGASLAAPFDGGESLGKCLMTPTRIYVRAVRRTMEEVPIKGLAHITGGGLTLNIGRILPAGLCVRLDRRHWTMPPIIRWVREAGGIEDREMFRTFNCGIGMALVVSAHHVDDALRILGEAGEEPTVIGKVLLADDGHREQVIID